MQPKSFFCLLFFFLFSATAFAQRTFTISGTVKSRKTGKTLIGASVRAINNNKGTISNEYGFYSLTLAEGSYQLEVNAIGAKADTVSVALSKNIQLSLFLQEENATLANVTVQSSRSGRSISGTQTGVEKLSTADIKNIPVLFGEKMC